MTILLVGATGFLGSAVAERLHDREAIAMVRASTDRRALPVWMPVRTGNLDEPSTWPTAFDGIDTLLFCASMGFGHVPPLLAFLEQSTVRRAVWISTTAIFTGLPAASRQWRVAAEAAIQRSSLRWTILRPTMIYGSERDRNVSRLLRWLSRVPLYPLFGSGTALHQPILVDDLADAVLAALATDATVGTSYNLAGAAPLTYSDLVQCAGRAVGRHVVTPTIPLGLALTVVRLASRMPLRVPVSPEQVQRLAEDKAFDYAAAVRDFGFRTRSFAEGVKLEAARMGLAPFAIDSGHVASAPRLG